MRQVALIGGGGYLGVNIISRIQNDSFFDSYSIYILDLNLAHFENTPIDMKRIRFFKGSFLDEALLDQVLHQTDTVFHIAAVGIMGASGGDEKLINRVNVDGTKYLVEKCKEHNVKRFVYASSVVVGFIGKPIYLYPEDAEYPDESKYLNYYSRSKARAERHVLSQSNESFKTCALRFRGIYGPGDPNATNRVIKIIKSGLFMFWFSSHADQAITQHSSINNCAESFLLAEKMLVRSGSPHGSAYHILDGEVVAGFDFWSPVFTELGCAKPFIKINYALVLYATRIYEKLCYSRLRLNPLLTECEVKLLAVNNTYDMSKAKKELGYVPEKSQMDQVVDYMVKMEHKKSNVNFVIIIIFSCIWFILFHWLI